VTHVSSIRSTCPTCGVWVGAESAPVEAATYGSGAGRSEETRVAIASLSAVDAGQAPQGRPQPIALGLGGRHDCDGVEGVDAGGFGHAALVRNEEAVEQLR
jgi:hypothetical protein